MQQSTRWLSILSALLILTLSQLAFAASLTRGPYLQMASEDAITVRWRTNSATDSVVRYGSSPSSLTETAVVSGTRTNHEVRIEGLNADTQYYYSVGSSSETIAGADASYRFATSPTIGTAVPTRIWIIGDSGTANSNARAVYNAYRNHSGSENTDLWIMLGDNAYNDGTDSQYQRAVFDMYPELLRSSTLWSTLGNHDGYTADSSTESGPYYDIFTLPRNAQSGGLASGTEAYYSFDYGNIHFICLDSYETDRSASGAMMTWLADDLAANTQPWTIAFWHHPPYSKGSHNSDIEGRLIDMRKNALPILESYGVDLVFSGHSHSYERSYLINGHYGSSRTFDSSHQIDGGDGRTDGDGAYNKASGSVNAGAVYTVAGSSGKISGGRLNHPAMFASLNQLGSVVLDINGNQLGAKFLNSDGDVTDYYTLVKGDDNIAPTLLSANALSQNTVRVAFSEAITETSAQNAANYNISGGVSVTAASLQPGAKSVQLTTSELSANNSYTLTVNNVEDLGGNVVAGNNQLDFGWNAVQTVSFQHGADGYSAAEDSYIGDGVPSRNFGNAVALLADRSDGDKGELISLLKWDVSVIPNHATVTEVKVVIDVFNTSAGRYQLWDATVAWNEDSVTWNSVDPYSNRGSQLGSFVPLFKGVRTITLNAEGVSAVQGWIDGAKANNGLYILSGRSSNGTDIRSSEYAVTDSRPKLVVTYRSN